MPVSEAQSANHLTPSEPADLGAESGEFGLLLEETPIRLHDEREDRYCTINTLSLNTIIST